jgi:hypothetical protein
LDESHDRTPREQQQQHDDDGDDEVPLSRTDRRDDDIPPVVGARLHLHEPREGAHGKAHDDS